MSRGDVIPIDSRSHLEVADRKHRYAKNLRTYFKEYHRINGLSEIVERSVTNNGNSTPSRKWSRYEPFFDWLDSEEPVPNLSECPRNVLDEDKVEYLTTDAEREPYAITINAGGSGDGNQQGDALWRMTQSGEPVNTGPKGWIFVLLHGRMFACEKRTSTFPRFHHSSFFAGAGVSAAGMLVCVEGRLTKLFPHSGHYRPHDRHLYSLLAFLRDKGVDLGAVQVDVQRVMKLSRQQDKDGSKAKKTESAFYLDGETSYNFLKSKTGFQESGVLRQIDKRRQEFAEGEQTMSVSVSARAKRTASDPPACTPQGEKEGEGEGKKSTMTIDTAAGTLPVLLKAESVDSPSSHSHIHHKLRLTLATSTSATSPSNRSSLNRLSLNSTGTGASTVGSGSPFCSPVAQHQYPLRSSSGSAGDLLAVVGVATVAAEGEAAFAGSSSVFADKGSAVNLSTKSCSSNHNSDNNSNNNSNNNSSFDMRGGPFFGSGSADDEMLIGNNTSGASSGAATFDATFGGELGRSGGRRRSSADARARVLSTLLYADNGNSGNSGKGAGLPVGQIAGSSGISSSWAAGAGTGAGGTHPSSPPLPPGCSRSASSAAVSIVSNNNSAAVGGGSVSGLLYVHTGIATAAPITKIPVAAPIKKVTSYTSISSSYGSTSYLQHQYFGGGSSRSRSASKTTDDLENDLRVLLGDSPVVHAPLDYAAYSSPGLENSATSPTNGGRNTSTTIFNTSSTSGAASTCNSRNRSRVSSFNPPYLPASAASYANSNIAMAAATPTETPLPLKLAAGQNPSNSSGGGGSGGGSRGHTPVMGSHHSPAEKVSPRITLISHMSSGGSKGFSLSAAVPLQDGAEAGSGQNPSKIEPFTPPPLSADRIRTPTSDMAIPCCATHEAVKTEEGEGEGVEEEDGGEGEGLTRSPASPASPVPSFASSLSSTDSLPNMMLDYVLSPGGSLQHCDGLYEEAQGDHYLDYFYGGAP